MSRKYRSFVLASATLGILGATSLGGESSAEAAPTLGSVKPAARVRDANDRTFSLQSVQGKPTLVLYEDKDSAKVNVALKDDLSRLARGDKYRSAVVLVPVADVERFDFWPARGFVKDAIRDESKKIGATIYCDWDGSFRRAVKLARNTSSVLLFGRDGRVLFAWEGQVPKEERERLLSMLRAEVEPRAEAEKPVAEKPAKGT
jgi:hypothetical protein